jgi:hypothetical protein
VHIASLGGQQRVKPTIWRAIIAFKAVANPLPQQESSHPQRRMTTTHGRPHAESPPSGRVGNRDETEDAAHYGGRDVPAQRTPMAAMVVLTIVTVGGRQYDLMAHQRSKNSWIACGNFNGEPLEGTGRSPSAAAHDWREKARWIGAFERRQSAGGFDLRNAAFGSKVPLG